jgi:hypothetical protein
MAHKQKGITIRCMSWCKHLRKDGKKHFWGRQRQADKRLCKEQ